MGMDPRFMGGVPDLGQEPLGPTKKEMQRVQAMSVVQSLTLGEHAPVKLDPASEKAGTQVVDLAKKIEKYLDTGN